MGKTSKITEPCCVCGKTREEIKGQFGRYNGNVYCYKHLRQMIRHGRILEDNKTRGYVGNCCICGEKGRGRWKDGNDYCRKHYLQMSRHGHILERTIYDGNEYIDHPDEGYTECVLYDKNFNDVGHTIIDLEDKEEVSKYKIYKRTTTVSGKDYAMVSFVGGEKIFLHRFIMGIRNTDYKLSECVDHINGNSLDNRKSNLRICSHKENMKNIRKGEKHICGVAWLRENKKWTARIMSDYKSIHLGNYDTFEEAVYARIKGEKEYCGEYSPAEQYFWILNSKNPIEEIKKIGFDKPEILPPELPKQYSNPRKSLKAEEMLKDIKNKQQQE